MQSDTLRGSSPCCRYRVHPEVPGCGTGRHLASALRVCAAVDTAISGVKSGRLDLNQRPFGPQPNALLVSGGAVDLLFRIPMRFQLL
jgi:hypothetical protein